MTQDTDGQHEQPQGRPAEVEPWQSDAESGQEREDHRDEAQKHAQIHSEPIPTATQPPTLGACRCARTPTFKLSDCVCEWGRALDLFVRWGWNATDEQIATEIGIGDGTFVRLTLQAGRNSALRRLAGNWRSSRPAFCLRYGLSSSRLGQLRIKLK